MTLLELRDWLNNLNEEWLKSTKAQVLVSDGRRFNVANWRMLKDNSVVPATGDVEIIWQVGIRE